MSVCLAIYIKLALVQFNDKNTRLMLAMLWYFTIMPSQPITILALRIEASL